MALPATPPLVVSQRRTTNVGGQSATRSTLAVDLQVQGLSDLRWMLRTLAANDTAEQIRLQNPPSAVVVDNRPSRSFEDAQRRIVVLYGSRLASAAMRLIENTLRQNIQKATVARTGRLVNVQGSWRWRLITPGEGSRVISSAHDVPTFTRGSVLVLEPYSAPHATRVNSLVLGSGSLKARRSGRLPKGQHGPPKPKQPVGFLRATAEAVRANSALRQFAVTVVFSKRYTVPGELSRKQGTGSIVIQLKRR